ncbi:MAG TPA: DedA family protein [Pseudonocardiaceae bacterium]
MTLASDTTLAWSPLDGAGPGAVWLIVLVFVFVECAFLIGLFLPGDSLLFAAGVVLAQHGHETSVWLLSLAVCVVSVVGNQVGYQLGERTSALLVARQNARVLNHQNLERAKAFVDRWGFWAVFFARWLPWVRTLAPALAGATRMDRRRFLVANVAGTVIWAPVLLLLGFYAADLLGQHPWLQTVAVVAFAVIVVVGTGLGVWRYRQDTRRPVDASESPGR